MAERALRVLGFAYRELQARGTDLAEGEMEVDGLVWTGLAGLADPVRSGLPALMEKLHRAGIQTVMLTGDQSATARAVADQIGLSPSGEIEIVDAVDLDALEPSELASRV